MYIFPVSIINAYCFILKICQSTVSMINQFYFWRNFDIWPICKVPYCMLYTYGRLLWYRLGRAQKLGHYLKKVTFSRLQVNIDFIFGFLIM